MFFSQVWFVLDGYEKYWDFQQIWSTNLWVQPLQLSNPLATGFQESVVRNACSQIGFASFTIDDGFFSHFPEGWDKNRNYLAAWDEFHLRNQCAFVR